MHRRKSDSRDPVPEPTAQATLVRAFYRTLASAWSPQHWWPADSPIEVIVGAYLTQNSAWTNVERALANLRAAHLLSVNGIRETPLPRLEILIRPSGYFRQKARRLKTFVEYLDACHHGSLDHMFAQPTEILRNELLELNGVGPETADSILLYAGNHPVFVVDTYTRRILDRHGILPLTSPYEDIRRLFERALDGGAAGRQIHATGLRKNSKAAAAELSGAAHKPSFMSTSRRPALVQTFNEMHALIVGAGKNYCAKKEPKCGSCPLRRFLPAAPVRSEKIR